MVLLVNVLIRVFCPVSIFLEGNLACALPAVLLVFSTYLSRGSYFASKGSYSNRRIIRPRLLR